jgi:hypothetical protein
MQTRRPEAIRVGIFVSVLLPLEGSLTKTVGRVEFTGSHGSKDAEMVSAHGPARSRTDHQI